MSNVKQRADVFFDYRAPSIAIGIAEYRNGMGATFSFSLPITHK